MSSRDDVKSLLAKCEELRVRSARIREYVEAQDQLRKTIYETNRTLMNSMKGRFSRENRSPKLYDVPLIRESPHVAIIDNPNTDT